MGNLLVSVIIPVYNVEKYVAETLDSVLMQTFQDYEVICINDGSTDRSGEIIESYAQKDARIRCIHQENGGLSAARNTGIKSAEGRYVYFLDSDDLIVKECLSVLVEKAEEAYTDILMFDGQTFFDGEELEQQFSQYTNFYQRTGEYREIKTGRELFADMMLQYDFYPQASLYFYKKSFLEQYQLLFPEGILYEDNLFAFEALMAAGNTLYFNVSLFQRRIRLNSIITGAVTKRNVWGNYYTSLEILDFLNKESLTDRVFYASCCLAKNRMKDAASAYHKLDANENKEFGIYFVSPDLIVLMLERIEKQYRIFLNLTLGMENKDKEIIRISGVRDEMYEQIRSLRDEISKKNQWLIDKDNVIKIREKRIADLEVEVTTKKNKIEQQSQIIANRDGAIKQKDAELIRLNELIADRNKYIDDLHNSLSFRIGRLLTLIPRKIKGLLKRD